MKKFVVISSFFISSLILVACQPANKAEQTDQTIASNTAVTSAAAQSALNANAASASASHTTATPKQINWQLVDSGVKPVNKASFKYPFALDSEPVKAYAEMYHVDNETSRYNLTVGMATNEILSKVLDQIGTDYVSHELTAGKDSAFIIHTTKKVVPSEYTYVIADPFAKGLTIAVKVINDGKK